jgi:hypothetical protein
MLKDRHGVVLKEARQAQFDALVEKLSEGFTLKEVGAWSDNNGPGCFYLRKGERWSRNPSDYCWISSKGEVS